MAAAEPAPAPAAPPEAWPSSARAYALGDLIGVSESRGSRVHAATCGAAEVAIKVVDLEKEVSLARAQQ